MSSEPWSLMTCEPLKKLSYIIERDWDPDKFHLLFHSSGYDSRIFSSILMKLREKHGEGWIGKILFLCWEPEGALFEEELLIIASHRHVVEGAWVAESPRSSHFDFPSRIRRIPP